MTSTGRAQIADHLECYKIKDPLRLKGIVDLDSPQFGQDAGCKISKAKLFCVPASKTVRESNVETRLVTGEPQSDDRICYKIKCPPASPVDQETSDQFGTRVLSRVKPTMVYTPARKGNLVDSSRYPTLQAAIDAVPDGGTLRLAPGSYQVDAPLYVRSKRIFIKGPGRRGTETTELGALRPLRVVEAASAVGVINFVDGSGGLEGFEIAGGDAAVVIRGTSSASFAVKDMNLGHTGRGILHLAPSHLTVEDSAIHDCLWNGISFAPKNLHLVTFLPLVKISGHAHRR